MGTPFGNKIFKKDIKGIFQILVRVQTAKQSKPKATAFLWDSANDEEFKKAGMKTKVSEDLLTEVAPTYQRSWEFNSDMSDTYSESSMNIMGHLLNSLRNVCDVDWSSGGAAVKF